MSSVAQTVLPTSVKPAVAAGPIDDAQVRWNRVAFSAGLIGLIFFFGYHDWKISLYEDYAGTSDLMESFTAEGNLSRRIAIMGLGIGSIVILLRERFSIAVPKLVGSGNDSYRGMVSRQFVVVD